MAGEDGAGIFHSGTALDERFHEISNLRGDVNDDGENDDGQKARLLDAEQAAARVDQADTQ